MSMIARLGDPLTHGAKIVSGLTDKLSDGKPTATIGSTVSCPIHGTNRIINVTTTVISDGKPTDHVSARAACGAVIIIGSTDVLIG